MISIEQINGEIAALEEEKPTHVIMDKLANLYIVRDHIILGTQPSEPVAAVMQTVPLIDTGSNFASAISGKNAEEVLALMDELMTTLMVTDPRLYDSVMRKI